MCNDRPRPYGSPALDHRVEKLPVLLRLEVSAGGRGTRRLVVHEDDAVPDEDLVPDRHAAADEGVALNLAELADRDALLDFDEGADPARVADRAAVEVDERHDYDVVAELDLMYQAPGGVVARPSILVRHEPSI